MTFLVWGALMQGVRTSSEVISLFQLRRSRPQAEANLGVTCDEDWGIFGDGPLQRTSINPSPWHGAMDGADEWEFPEADSAYIRSEFPNVDVERLGIQFLFVDPAMKFAFCPIEKNACSFFDQTMTRLLTRNTSYVIPKEMPEDFLRTYSVGAIAQERYGMQGIKQVFADPDATRAVFVRDPLHRFLSAYLNKCLHPTPEETETNCPMYKPGITFKDAVEWALQTDMQDVNPHWKLQAYHCHLHKYIASYNIIGVVSGSLSEDAQCLFEKAGLAGYNQEFLIDENGRAKRDGGFRSATKGGNTDDELLKLFFPPAVAKNLIHHFAIEYSTFHFDTSPAWLEQATGQYYETQPPLDENSRVILPSSVELPK